MIVYCTNAQDHYYQENHLKIFLATPQPFINVAAHIGDPAPSYGQTRAHQISDMYNSANNAVRSIPMNGQHIQSIDETYLLKAKVVELMII